MEKDKGRIKEALPLNVIYILLVILPKQLFLGCSACSYVVPGLRLGYSACSWLVLWLFRLFLGRSGVFRLLDDFLRHLLQLFC